MNIGKKFWMATLLAACGLATATGQETRTIKLINDIDQKYMTSKVYELKNIRCDDITPWIYGAVYRYNQGSTVQRLNYPVGKKQYIVVTTGVDMMPYVDDMVAKMDKPTAKKDANGSIVDGTGIYNFTYCPKYRTGMNPGDGVGTNSTMLNAIQKTRSDGQQYFDAATNTFYWKDSKSDGETALKWLTALDRPQPQASLQLNVYEVTDNDFVELGLDWIAWKNGPGANLFGWGHDYTNFKSFSDIAVDGQGNNVLADGALGGLTGFMVAPQFDATFLRMLAQKGKAKIAHSGYITFVNDFGTAEDAVGAWDDFAGANYKLQFTPQYQVIQKDGSMNLSTNHADPTYRFYIKKPILCFGTAGDKTNVAMFHYYLNMSNTVDVANDLYDATNASAPLAINQSQFASDVTMAMGTEKLLATYTKEQKVNQNNGIPYLQDIPGLKYAFGATGDTVSKTRVFVTVTVTPVVPSTNLSQWAGEIVEAAKLPAPTKE